MTLLSHRFLHDGPRRPPEPTAPPRADPPFPRHRGDALRFHATDRMAQPDWRDVPDLAVRRRRPRHARDRGALEDRLAEHPPPRSNLRDHRGRPRGEVVLRSELDGPRIPRIVRSLDRRELDLGRLAHDFPRGHQHLRPHLPHGTDLAPHPRSAPHDATWLYHSHRTACGRHGDDRPPPHALPAVGLAPDGRPRRGHLPDLGRAALCRPTLGLAPCAETTEDASPLR